MTYLLDTHVWLWMVATPDRITPEARAIIEDGDTRLLLSAASSWEIAIKYAIGRLELPDDPADYVPDRMRRTGVEGLAIHHSHALRVATLEHHHRDPFDRVLVAQAEIENIPIVTADPAFHPYGVEILWAA